MKKFDWRKLNFVYLCVLFFEEESIGEELKIAGKLLDKTDEFFTRHLNKMNHFEHIFIWGDISFHSTAPQCEKKYKTITNNFVGLPPHIGYCCKRNSPGL